MSALEGVEYGLTIQDPWAQAIVWGPKRIENRTWKPPEKVVGERIAISTSKTVDEESCRALQAASDTLGGAPWSEYHDWIVEKAEKQDVPATVGYRHHPGHVIGTVEVVGYWHAIPKAECEQDYSGTDVSGPVVQEHIGDREWGCDHDPDRDEWWQGPIGWLLDDPQPLDDPVPVRGMPGVWDVDQQLKEET